MLRILVLLLCFLLTRLYGQQPHVENIELLNGDFLLPGTLTFVPSKEAKLPLVLFVHESGNIDSNSNPNGLGGTPNYIKILNRSLAPMGIASYCYGKHASVTANFQKLSANIVLNDFVEDVRIAIDYFKRDARFSDIILVGHSQGSLVAMLAMDASVSKFISLAGAGEPIDQKIVSQLYLQNKDMAETARQYFDELRKTDTIQSVHPFPMSLFAPKNQKFIKNWMRFDPTIEIKNVSVPILIIQGEADMQVGVQDAENLYQAAPKAKLTIVPKMNHVLKEADSKTDNLPAYTDEKFPLSTILVGAITEFIKS